MARTAVRATISIPWKNLRLLTPYIPPSLSLPRSLSSVGNRSYTPVAMCIHICLKLQTLKHLIYHSCAAKPANLAFGESSRRYEGRANCEANHLQPHKCQPGGDPVRQRAQAGE